MRYPDLRRTPRRPAAWLMSLAATVALSACGEVPTQVQAPTVTAQMATITSLTQAPEVEKLYVCKDGPTGTYQFSAKVTSGSILQQNGVDPVLLQDADKDGDSEFTVDAGTCLWVGLAGGTPARVVEVTEAANAGTEFVNTTIKQLSYGVVTTTTGGNPSSGTLSGSPALDGAVIIFTNKLSEPSLSVTKTADAASVAAGSNIGFGITVNSNGPGTALGVTLTDVLPTGSGISWSIDAQPAGNPCAIAAGTLTCNFGDMASGASATVHITSPTTTASCAVYSNTASADGDNLDPITSTASTTVTCPALASGTATGAGFPWSATQGAPKNWFMYTPWVTTGGYQGISPSGTNLIAGKTNVAGTITGTRGATTSITITLNSGYTFVDGVGNVAINPMSCTTSQPYVSPGQFTVKATVSSASNTITVSGLPNTACYGIHTNVSWMP